MHLYILSAKFAEKKLFEIILASNSDISMGFVE